MTTYIAYLRVSTEDQGNSGLGLEAQRAAIDAFVSRTPDARVHLYLTETMSGCKDDRPRLASAIRHCKVLGASLLVAKFDRLSRNVACVENVRQQVKVVSADSPVATDFEVHIRAAMAQEERRLISVRTKAALAARKARGEPCGGWRGHPVAEATRTAAAAALKRGAEERASDRYVDVQDIRAAGIVSLKGIAAELNRRGILTPSGSGTWTATSVKRLLARVA